MLLRFPVSVAAAPALCVPRDDSGPYSSAASTSHCFPAIGAFVNEGPTSLGNGALTEEVEIEE